MLLDIKLGILWALLVSLVFGEPITWEWFGAGILFALLPDLDFWIEYLKRGTVGGKKIGAHRTLFHTPLPYIPLALLIGFFCGPAWAALFCLGVFGHLIHDLVGMGFGIRLFWPFSSNFHKLMSDREGHIRYDLFPGHVSWTNEEVAAVAEVKGNENWIREDIAYHLKHWPEHLLKFALLALLVWIMLMFFNT